MAVDNNNIICKTLTILENQVNLIAKTAAKLICIYKLKSWANAIILGKPETAIIAIAEQLGDAGASINAETALKAIDSEVEKIIPQLATLKNSTKVTLTNITEIHPINSTSLDIGIKIVQNKTLGSAKIDGIGFRIQTKKVNTN